jgi:LasA protease
MAPELNAGTAALQYLFAQLYSQEQWGNALYGPDNFATPCMSMFGNPWIRAQRLNHSTQPI